MPQQSLAVRHCLLILVVLVSVVLAAAAVVVERRWLVSDQGTTVWRRVDRSLRRQNPLYESAVMMATPMVVVATPTVVVAAEICLWED
jgi:uncharacterized membrane protein YidH (DUF202 family)